MSDWMLARLKAVVAIIGAAAVVALKHGTEFCDTIWPEIVVVLTAISTYVVPNIRKDADR